MNDRLMDIFMQANVGVISPKKYHDLMMAEIQKYEAKAYAVGFKEGSRVARRVEQTVNKFIKELEGKYDS